MSLQKYRQLALDVLALGQAFTRQPNESLRTFRPLADMAAGALQANAWPQRPPDQLAERSRLSSEKNENPLADYFEAHQTGRGILKWFTSVP
jgi:hypothetical protein